MFSRMNESTSPLDITLSNSSMLLTILPSRFITLSDNGILSIRNIKPAAAVYDCALVNKITHLNIVSHIFLSVVRVMTIVLLLLSS
mmetsp:Transcript_25201/g.24945  ORF Transcript_25201/g.24945 Transcript_25201/m.24945 type:complete len:86 (-) Transcript_25201:90-347(-)